MPTIREYSTPADNSLQSIAVLEILEALDARHGEVGVPFKDLEAAAGPRLSFQALKDALNALVAEKAVARVSEKPARLRITATGRVQLDSYRS